MPLPVFTIETVGSQETDISPDDPKQELQFTLTGSTDRATIQALLEVSLTPTVSLTSTFFGTLTLVCQGYRFKHLGNGIWEGTAKYGRRQPRKTGDLVYNFDSTGGTQHIQLSKETKSKVGRVGETVAVPDCNGAIGVNGQTVAGVDITIPVYKFTLEYYAPTAQVNADYLFALQDLAGSVNDAPFVFQPTNFPDLISWDEGEVLFLGATGQPRSWDDWQILMHFAGSPNVSNFSIGGLTPFSKDGHNYFWAMFPPITNGQRLVVTPKFGYCERVYDENDFSMLGLP